MTRNPITVRRIANLTGGAVEGDGSTRICGIDAIDTAGPTELTFAVDQKHAALLADSHAGAALVSTDAPPAPMALIRVDDVQAAMAKLLTHFAGPEDLPAAGVHPSAVIAPDAQVAATAAIGPGVVIGGRAKIADACVLCGANVCIGADAESGAATICREGVVIQSGCRVGSRVRIGPNSVIGYEGFGYYTKDGVHHTLPHVGNVVIEDDVELGICCCVDRAKFGSTRIGADTKIDNLVQVGHNVQMGPYCLLAAQVGIAGSAKVGQHVVMGGHVGIRDNITIGDRVQCAAFSAVAADVPDGQVVLGIPAGPIRDKRRVLVAADKLPELIKRVKKLEARLQAIESSKDH